MKSAEFQEKYHARQLTINASDDLKEKTFAAILEKDTSESAEKMYSSARASAQASRRSPKKRKSTKGFPWTVPSKRQGSAVLAKGSKLMAAAACLLVVALVAGLTLALPGSQGGQSFLSDFVVKAYASDSNTLLEYGSDGKVIFDRAFASGSNSNAVKMNGGKPEALYTGCLFTVEGEGIVRLQATVSFGELYRQTVEEFTVGEDPARFSELNTWKPSKIGLGTYYNNVDDLRYTTFADRSLLERQKQYGSLDEFLADNQDLRYQVFSIKRMGQTVDIPLDLSGETKTFLGLRTSYPESDGESWDITADSTKAIDSFEGQTLTVTAVFEDGHCSTQVIELHAADMKADLVSYDELVGGYPNRVRLIPELADTSGLSEEDLSAQRLNGNIIRSLYGEVIEANSNPFPASLENANEREFILDPLPTFDAAPMVSDETFTVSGSYVVGDTVRVVPKRLMPKEYREDSFDYPFDYRATKVTTGQSLPEGLTLSETDFWASCQGDMEYAQKVLKERSGLNINQDGSLGEGASYITVELDITNPGSEEQSLFLGAFGEYAVKTDDPGNLASIWGGMASFDCSHTVEMRQYEIEHKKEQRLVLQPGETKHIIVTSIIKSELLPNLVLVLDADRSIAVSLAPQDS